MPRFKVGDLVRLKDNPGVRKLHATWSGDNPEFGEKLIVTKADNDYNNNPDYLSKEWDKWQYGLRFAEYDDGGTSWSGLLFELVEEIT